MILEVETHFGRRNMWLYMNILMAIAYRPDGLPQGFTMPFSFSLAPGEIIPQGAEITPWVVDCIKSRIPRFIEEIRRAEVASVKKDRGRR